MVPTLPSSKLWSYVGPPPKRCKKTPSFYVLGMRETSEYMHAYACTHTCIHTYIPTYVRTYVHTLIRSYVHTYIRTYVHTYIRTYVHTYIHTYIRTCIHAYMQKYILSVYPYMTHKPLKGPHFEIWLPKYLWSAGILITRAGGLGFGWGQQGGC